MGSAIQLIVGLGNPESRHATDRHNAGFWFVDQLAGQWAIDLRKESRFFSEAAQYGHGASTVRLAKPQTFMNLSGQAVVALANFYRIKPAEILIVHDDVDLPPGTVRLKTGGGHGGHNGLRNIIEQLGSREFQRLRIGIGHPGDRDKVVAFVLSKPSRNEQQLIDDAMDAALKVMPDILAGNDGAAMQELHSRENGNQATP